MTIEGTPVSGPRPEFYNHPHRLRTEHYGYALEAFLERFTTVKAVRNVYQFVEVTQPGLSNLNFIVVLASRCKGALTVEHSVRAFDKALRYILNDTPPVLMDEEIFAHFWKLFPCRNLKKVHGHALHEAPCTYEERRLHDLMTLVDLCNLSYPGVFLEIVLKRVVNVRNSLLLLGALKVPLEIFESVGGTAPQRMKALTNAVDHLRARWFTQPKEDAESRLWELLQEALPMSLALTVEIDHFLKRNFYTVRLKVPVLEYMRLAFVEPYDVQDSLSRMEKEYEGSRAIRSFLPATLALPLYHYARQKGPVSDYIQARLPKEALETRPQVLKDLEPILADRAKWMNLHAEFYSKNAIPIPMVHFYYDYDPLRPEKAKPTRAGFLGRFFGKT